MIETKPCPTCGGDGWCWPCDGEGRVVTECGACGSDRDDRCAACVGSGECRTCLGTGQVSVTDGEREAQGQRVMFTSERTADPGFGYSGYDEAMLRGGEPD